MVLPNIEFQISHPPSSISNAAIMGIHIAKSVFSCSCNYEFLHQTNYWNAHRTKGEGMSEISKQAQFLIRNGFNQIGP